MPLLINPIRTIVICAAVLACTTSFAADLPENETDKTLYAIGLSVARSLSVFDLSPAELEVVQRGITDALKGKTSAIDLQSYNGKIQEFARERRKGLGEKQAGAGMVFLENAAKEKGAVRMPSGMVYTALSEGKGDSPTGADVVKVNYRGTLIDGREFESSYKRGKPLEFKLENVIKCWTEGIQKMKPGGKAKFVCPPHLAYGENGAGESVLPGSTLIFEVELLEVKSAAANPAGSAPAKAANPPKPAMN